MSTYFTACNKRLIFVLSPGRCGTDSLSRILRCLDGVDCRHEPYPDFAEVMRPGQHYRPLLLSFLIERKIPYIVSLDTEIYAETSHLFIQGFVRPLLMIGIVPDIVILHRPKRDVALSMWRSGGIPGRNFMGQKYLLQPDDYVLRPVTGVHWHTLTDYELCYWFTLEISARIGRYIPLFTKAGSRIVNIQTSRLSDPNEIDRLTHELGLSGSVPEDVYATRWNAGNGSNAIPVGIDESESRVLEVTGSSEDTPWARGVAGGWWGV